MTFPILFATAAFSEYESLLLHNKNTSCFLQCIYPVYPTGKKKKKIISTMQAFQLIQSRQETKMVSNK